MRTFIKFGFLAVILSACNSGGQTGQVDLEQVVFQPEDREIFREVMNFFKGEEEIPHSKLMIEVGRFFLGTPYVAHTLEREQEQLVINLRQLDCTTFAENCLALCRTLNSEHPGFEQFAFELQHIRYRDGHLEGYPSRLHYFCDWIHNNEEKGLVKDMSRELGTGLRKEIYFMSTHPESYDQLTSHPDLVEKISQTEAKISAREKFYIPKKDLKEVESQLREGDIVGIATSIDGIAVMHVGILVKVEDRIHLMHGSSSADEVVISDGTLADYLAGRKNATGILLARPL